jgi:hypothetical protein
LFGYDGTAGLFGKGCALKPPGYIPPAPLYCGPVCTEGSRTYGLRDVVLAPPVNNSNTAYKYAKRYIYAHSTDYYIIHDKMGDEAQKVVELN